MFLYHYYQKGTTPFLSLSDLSDEEAYKIHSDLESISEDNYFKKRNSDGKYMFWRHIVEDKLYSKFIEKGGKPQRKTPYYMMLGKCNFGKIWFKTTDIIKIPLEEFDKDTISFTYGDSFPTFDPTHGENQEYRQNVYTYNEIWEIIEKYGTLGNVKWDENTPYWKPIYVEVQIWSDKIINKYIKNII